MTEKDIVEAKFWAETAQYSLLKLEKLNFVKPEMIQTINNLCDFLYTVSKSDMDLYEKYANYRWETYIDIRDFLNEFTGYKKKDE